MPNKLKKGYLFILPWTLVSLGGVNQVVKNLFFQMKLDGKYNPIVVVNSWNDTKIRKENIEGIDHYFFQLRSPWAPSKKIVNFIMFFLNIFRTIYHFYYFIKLNKISTINVHYCSLFVLNINILKLLKIYRGKIVLSFHGKDLLDAKESQGFENILWKMALYCADTIVVCSDFLKNELNNFDNSLSNKIITIHNGIDISLFSDTVDRDIDSKLKGKKFILNVATLEHKKGQDVLLKAFQGLTQDYIDIFLVIIGRPGGAENQIKKLINLFGLSDRVCLYEGLSHNQVLGFMKRATIFVLPSRYEPFGIVILEAGVFAVPVIASNIGGIREILTHNTTGKLFDPEDVDSLTKEMSSLLIELEERNRLGKNLREHVLKNFSWKKTYQKYLDGINL